jgi:hypothetical protein
MDRAVATLDVSHLNLDTTAIEVTIGMPIGVSNTSILLQINIVHYLSLIRFDRKK